LALLITVDVTDCKITVHLRVIGSDGAIPSIPVVDAYAIQTINIYRPAASYTSILFKLELYIRLGDAIYWKRATYNYRTAKEHGPVLIVIIAGYVKMSWAFLIPSSITIFSLSSDIVRYILQSPVGKRSRQSAWVEKDVGGNFWCSSVLVLNIGGEQRLISDCSG